jgi:hypothetical protein
LHGRDLSRRNIVYASTHVKPGTRFRKLS